ncbi:hypothetical protein [Bradyrhizobium sp. USDA 4451]
MARAKSKKTASKKKVSKTKPKKATKKRLKKQPKNKKPKSAKKARAKKGGAAKARVAKRAAPERRLIMAVQSDAVFNDLLERNLLRPSGRGANDRVLDGILGGHYPDDTKLDPPYDGAARAGLADRIQRAGVPVSDAKIISCTTVGCVRGEMDRVNPGGRR